MAGRFGMFLVISSTCNLLIDHYEGGLLALLAAAHQGPQGPAEGPVPGKKLVSYERSTN